MPTHRPDALKFLTPAWYTLPMGLAGLGMAWLSAAPLMGEMASAIALLLGVAAAATLVALVWAGAVRSRRHPGAWAEDTRHPVRQAYVAALPIALILLATLGAQLLGPLPVLAWLWAAGGLGLLAHTVWTLGRLWRPASDPTRLGWAAITPATLLPGIGHGLAPLGGLALDLPHWAAAQFGLGLLCGPLLLGLLVLRVLAHGPLAERLLPSLFLLIAPPAVAGLSLLAWGTPGLLAWGCWGMALFGLLWAGSVLGRIRQLPFSLAHWTLSFPLAMLAALTLRLASPGAGLAVLGPLLLALSSLVVLGLSVATWRGLREGSLLAPEVVMPIVTAG